MEKHELIKNEVYKHENGNIVKYQFNGDNNDKIKGFYIGNNADIFYKNPSSNFNIKFLILATLEEKHWLESCIKANKFIPYDKTIKTFIPEYVECTIQYNKSNYKLGKIYKIKLNGKIGENEGYYIFNKIRFKPSTKKDYDAQFVIKQLETPKDKILKNCHKNHNLIKKVESSEGAIYQIGDKITVFTKNSLNKGKLLTIKSFRWNNAKTEICVITEIHTLNGIGLDKIELYSESIVTDTFVLPKK